MARKWEKSDLISYLYGEIDPQEKVELEKAFNESPELRKEFQEAEETSGILGKLEDKEVIPPHFLLENENSVFSKIRPYRKYMAVAASVLVLFLAGYITGASIEISDNQVTLGWSNNANSEELLTREQMDQLINEKVQELQSQASKDFDKKLDDFRDELDVKLVDFRDQSNREIFRMVSNETQSQRDRIDLMVSELKEQNLESIAEFLEINNRTQEEDVKQMLADFSDFLNRQRVEDLVRIDQNFRTLQDNSESKFEETGVILASIMETVNTTRNE